MSDSVRHKERRRKRAKRMQKGNERGGGWNKHLMYQANAALRERYIL